MKFLETLEEYKEAVLHADYVKTYNRQGYSTYSGVDCSEEEIIKSETLVENLTIKLCKMSKKKFK